ncbi:MAG TPA: DUF6159 family protein [Gemmatales bacterium]|nr:DUF6159 family protein [Gemmatales bacterium]HMP17247.1 DUF6159 family protein [Gemmatales bacterium]
MFESWNRSWEMITQSYAVLKRQKTLVLFPLCSGIACFLVFLSFLTPVVAFPEVFGRGARQAADPEARKWLLMLGGFLFYLINYFIIIFFNAALCACAVLHFKGVEPTLGDGLAAASRRLPQIAGWALVAATVGIILRSIQERSEWVGKLVIGLIGLAWTVVTYLVVPILAIEGLSPIDALKRSSTLMRRTWGEGITGGITFGLIGFLIMLPGFLLFAGGIFLIMSAGVYAPVLLVLAVVYLITAAIILSTLKQIYLSGLYLYAAEGQMPAGFTPEMVQGAFKHGKSK